MATPLGAAGRIRTDGLLVTNQLLYRWATAAYPPLSITISPGWAVTTLSYTPAWNCCSAGTTPSFHVFSLALRCQVHPRGITELFSPAPVQSVASVRLYKAGPAIYSLSVASRCRVAPPAAGAPFPCIVSGAWRLTHCGTGRNRTGDHGNFVTLRHHFYRRKLYLLSYCPVLPG